MVQDARAVLGETRVDPDALTGRHKARKDKAERMESVLEGRADRSYGAAAGRRKKKTGGHSPDLMAAQCMAPQLLHTPYFGLACMLSTWQAPSP